MAAMSPSLPPLTPLLLPFGDARSDAGPLDLTLPERPRGAAPTMVPLIRTRTSAARYGFARADSDGRLAIRTAVGALNWSRGTRLQADVRDLGIVVSAHPAGRLKLGAELRLRLPIALRRRSGLSSGLPALLVTDSALSELTIYSASALDAMIASWPAAKDGEGS